MAEPPAPSGSAPGSRLRLARLAAGLSQEQLAGRAEVSRQAVAGIEAGRWDPSLRVALDLAGALGRSVEDLFGPPATLPALPAIPLGPIAEGGARVEWSQVGSRRVVLPLAGDRAMRPGFAPAPGHVAEAAEGRAPVLVEAGADAGPGVVVAGCDPALALLAGPLGRLSPAVRLSWWHCNSADALELAAAGLVHAAGVHLADGDAGLGALVGDAFSAEGAEVVGFSAWREGLALTPGAAPGAPAGAGLSRLAEEGLPIVNREPGSEARALLDAELDRCGIAPADLPGYRTQVRAHLLVASAVAAGLGAAGVTIEPAARAYGLDFEPLASEVFRLVVPRATLQTPETQALLRVLSGPELRAELARLPGYDARSCGEAVCSL